MNEDDLPPDETIKIDEALYLADVRARTRYSKVFKKQQIDPKNEELFSNKLVSIKVIFIYISKIYIF